MNENKRVILIILDSLGIGAMPDAGADDAGANTLASLIRGGGDIAIPNLISLGLGNIDILRPYGLAAKNPRGAYGYMREQSCGKDTITGHWELMGVYTDTPFRTFESFPSEFMPAFEQAIDCETLGNYAASGTEIIETLGDEHEREGKPIVYTSADSVFQIAANTEVIPLERLYAMCEIARDMLVGDMSVGRVIARPYKKKDGRRTRTAERRDYAVSPPEDTVLDILKAEGREVTAIGKVNDIFNGSGISRAVHTSGNEDGISRTIDAIRSESCVKPACPTAGSAAGGLIFTNLVDFDSRFGHRRDISGYRRALEAFDMRLPEIMDAMGGGDILMITADHGNDPGHAGFNHTREYVPLLAWGHRARPVNLGMRTTFADVGATICEYLEVPSKSLGTSFLREAFKGK